MVAVVELLVHALIARQRGATFGVYCYSLIGVKNARSKDEDMA